MKDNINPAPPSGDLPPAIFLMGPTASGKTDLAVQLCQRLPCEVISVDSALIYREMDIGTAKPTPKELQSVPHQLIDILDPSETYSVANFRRDALAAMEHITKRGNIPLLVGGTMLYFKSLVDGLSPLPPAQQQVRDEILAEVDEKGWLAMHHYLSAIDPVSAKRIHANDPQRLLRALEVYKITGKTMTELMQQTSPKLPYEVKNIAIMPPDRAILHQRIEQRFMQMLTLGFEEEVIKLRSRGDLHIDMPSMRCVGYRQMWQYLDGEFSHTEMISRGLAATRQLAKRQLTWLRGWQDVNFLDGNQQDNLTRLIKLGNTVS